MVLLVTGGSAGCLADASMELRGSAVGEGCGDGDADADVDADADGDAEPGEGQVRVRVVHASPDAPAVDVYAAGSAVPWIEDLEYTQTSAFLTVPSGTYDFEVRAAGAPADDPPAYSTGESGAAGRRDRDGDRGGLARVGRRGLALPRVADRRGLRGRPRLAVGIAAAGSADPAAVFDLTPAAGTRAFALAAGALSAASDDESFRLLVVDTASFPWSVATVRPR